jgi:hypothetical protein
LIRRHFPHLLAVADADRKLISAAEALHGGAGSTTKTRQRRPRFSSTN